MTAHAPSHIEAERLGAKLVTFLQESEPGASPVDATAGMAIALGAMIAAMAELGLSKPGRSGAMLQHLFRMAEHRAEAALGPL